jgi:hypothetical protein
MNSEDYYRQPYRLTNTSNSSKIMSLVRRKKYLEQKIEEFDDEDYQKTYILQEIDALEWALPYLWRILAILKKKRDRNLSQMGKNNAYQQRI